ncbi:MAG: hypothetical protein WBQ34_07385 [Candidatus Acidiferrales bacterium]
MIEKPSNTGLVNIVRGRGVAGFLNFGWEDDVNLPGKKRVIPLFCDSLDFRVTMAE